MKTLNHIVVSDESLKTFLKKNRVDPHKEHFVQLFIGNNNKDVFEDTLKSVNKILPSSSIIATSTAGEIVDGRMLDNSTVVSITTFDSTKVKVQLIEESSEVDISEQIVSTMVEDSTKLILLFNNVFSNDGENILSSLEQKAPHVKVAGGNAGDNGKFDYQTVVGVNDKVSTTAIAVATLQSDTLKVFNDYLFNWRTIGQDMIVTKSENSTVYEINNQKVVDIYKHYLGDDISNELPASGVEFPLIFNEDGIDIARAPVALGDDGSLIMAGHVKEGSSVKFGFGDIFENDASIVKTISELSDNPVESIFIYSCSARKYFLGDNLNNEFEMLQTIAPTSGFITYGEFFNHNKCNKMLNVSSTFIGMSENRDTKHNISFEVKKHNGSSRTLKALANLVKSTSDDLEEQNLNLSQFKHLIKESTIYSATDTKGVITDVNQNFIDLSGYSRDELIGKSHNIIRDSSMPASVYKDMWDTIQSKKMWQGLLKNRAKDRSKYYVRSNIYPVLDVNGDIIEYVSIRDDVTEEVQRKELLEGTINYLESQRNVKDDMLEQYENIINLSSAFFRVDANFNIVHVNEVFCKIYKSSSDNLESKKVTDIMEPVFVTKEFNKHHKAILSNGSWSGVVPFIREDKSIIHMTISVSAIYDKNKNVVEYMAVLNDITDLIVAQEEIIDTQRDVVFTMGAIGETRSKETGNHVKRVAEYSRILAIHYGLGDEKAQLLKMASPMHDIGKVGIPDAILNKPGKLTDEEWIIMKTHSSLGYQMLKNSKREILQTAAIVAHTHHEQWDGNGYPKSLKGDEIHIYGRITAIADVFDALGSDRCYKKAWEDEKIFNLIKNGSGKHFDPDLVKIFFDHLDDFLEVRNKFRD